MAAQFTYADTTDTQLPMLAGLLQVQHGGVASAALMTPLTARNNNIETVTRS